MDYNHIKNYLEKFKNIISSKEDNLKIISSVIENNILLKIETKFIKIKPPIIYIKTTPLVRSEIMIRKNKILEDISKMIKDINFNDIR